MWGRKADPHRPGVIFGSLDRTRIWGQDFEYALRGRLTSKGCVPMTIKNILALPIDPHTNNSILTSALCIAKNFGAHIDFTHVKGDPSSYTGPMIEGRFRKTKIPSEEVLKISLDIKNCRSLTSPVRPTSHLPVGFQSREARPRSCRNAVARMI